MSSAGLPGSGQSSEGSAAWMGECKIPETASWVFSAKSQSLFCRETVSCLGGGNSAAAVRMRLSSPLISRLRSTSFLPKRGGA